MNYVFSRISGFLLIAGAILGIVLSIGGLYFIWTTQGTANQRLFSTLSTIDQTVTATTSMLATLSESLDQAVLSIDVIESSMATLNSTLQETVTMADSVGGMLGGEFVQVIEDTQMSLGSVEASARLIDDTLGIVSAVPFIGARYKPETSLQESISQVNSSLDALPGSLQSIQAELESTAANLETVETDLNTLSTNIGDIKRSLNRAKRVIVQYQQIVSNLESDMKTLETSLPRWITTLTWGVTIWLIWLLIAQLSLLLQGFGLILRPAAPVVLPPPEERIERLD